MEEISITVSDETGEKLDRYTRERHRGDRDRAVRVLLETWLDQR